MSVAGAERNLKSLALTLIAMCAVGVSVFWWARRGDAAVNDAAPAWLPAGGSPAPQRQQLAAWHDPNAEPHDTPPARADRTAVDDAGANPPLETAAAETAGADPPNERAESIRAMGAGELAQLTQVLRSDPLARNRLLAINGLRNVAKDPALAPQVLDLLRAAQSDGDANVARNARDAYQEFALD
jgi:hypothetical protein